MLRRRRRQTVFRLGNCKSRKTKVRKIECFIQELCILHCRTLTLSLTHCKLYMSHMCVLYKFHNYFRRKIFSFSSSTNCLNRRSVEVKIGGMPNQRRGFLIYLFPSKFHFLFFFSNFLLFFSMNFYACMPFNNCFGEVISAKIRKKFCANL